MISEKLINKTKEYFKFFSNKNYVVNPSLPILYFGNLELYQKSKIKIITVGKNPSDNEFKLNNADEFSFVRFPSWDEKKWNLIETLNEYFETKPLKQWFASFEPILNGMSASFYQDQGYDNLVIHTDICSPIATHPTWSKLHYDERENLYKEGNRIWKELIEELQPDIIFVSIPKIIFQSNFTSDLKTIIEFKNKKNGNLRKKIYQVKKNTYTLSSGKKVKIVFGEAANKPFGTLSNSQKIQIGKICQK